MGFMIKKPEGEVGKSWPAIVIGIFVAFGGVLYGYDTGTISGILGMPYWRRGFSKPGEDGVTSSEESLIVSILSLGTFLGALTAAPVADRIGRRWGLILATGIVFNFGVILQTAATKQPLFIAGRFFAGFGVGLISAMIPMYQSETAPKWIRGTIVGCYQLAITIGLFLAAIVNNSTAQRNDSGSYRIPVAIQFAWAIILVSGLLILPETPRFLIKQGKHEKAAKALGRIRRVTPEDPALQAELAEIEANHKFELSLGKASYSDCFRGTVLKRLITGCVLQALQQLSGVNFIFYYGTKYFQQAGFAQPFILQVITNSVNVASTFPGLWAVERMGRRNLLLYGAVGMCISQFIVAIVGTTSGLGGTSTQNAQFAFVCIYIFFFASSWGPVAWVVTGELFPLKARAKCLSFTTASNWLLNWAIAYATPYMTDEGAGHANLGPKVFFIWGSFCAVAIVFVFFMIYETKGLTLEQVDELYDMVNKAWLSKKFRPQVKFAEVSSDAAGQGRRGTLKEALAEQEHRRNSNAVADTVHSEKAV